MSYIPIPGSSDFTLSNIPFGIFSTPSNSRPRPGTALGDQILDLSLLSSSGILKSALSKSSAGSSDEICESLQKPQLNDFAALGKSARRAVREAILDIVKNGSEWANKIVGTDGMLVDRLTATLHLPMVIGDYTDFYAGKNHAFNVGTLFRGPANALQPNYTHLPVGYHGRASTVVVSGTPIRRPLGQTFPPGNATPNFGACQRLDIELEMACWISTSNPMGSPVDIDEAEDHVFGYSLMNDWSARDVQAWEYVPLGPFNSKNFGTSVGGWIITDEALESHRTARMKDDGELLEYLQENKRKEKEVFDVQLEVLLKPSGSDTLTPLFKGSSRNLLFSFPQMIAHHTITGCSLRTGDLLGSGTISGEDKSSVGCFLEATQNGKEEIEISDGTGKVAKRKWLEDGDEVVIRGFAGEGDARVGFGECSGKIEAAQWGRLSKVQGKKKET